MELGQLTAERDLAVTKDSQQIIQRVAQLVGRFVEDQGAVIVLDLFQMGIAALFTADGEETLKRKAGGYQTGDSQRGNNSTGTGNNNGLNVILRTQAHQILTGIGDAGHTGICNDSTVFSCKDPFDDLNALFPQIVLKIADLRLSDAEMIEDLHRNAGILCRNKIHRFQCLHGAGRKIRKVADGRAHHIELSCHLISPLPDCAFCCRSEAALPRSRPRRFR